MVWEAVGIAARRAGVTFWASLSVENPKKK
jgi:hypothetical protein